MQNFFFFTEDSILIFVARGIQEATADPEAILTFEAHGIGSDCWPWRLKFHMAEININLIHSIVYNITFQVYTRSTKDILIFMFWASLQQCKVDVGCICLTAILRKLAVLKNFHSRISGVITTPSVTSCTEVQKWSHLKYFLHNISVKLGIFMTLPGILKSLSKKKENPNGRGRE